MSTESTTSQTTRQTTLRISSSTFQQTSAYFGAALYNSFADVVLSNSFIALNEEESPNNQLFDVYMSTKCQSICQIGSYGNCTALGQSCASCTLNTCRECPRGRTGVLRGAVSLEDGCKACETGFSMPKAGQKSVCTMCKFF